MTHKAQSEKMPFPPWWLAAVVAAPMMLMPPLPAQAQSAEIPNGCQPVVTVHRANCSAATVMDCQNRFETHSYHEVNIEDISVFTRDWAMIGYTRLGNPKQTLRLEAAENSPPGFSFTQLPHQPLQHHVRPFRFSTNTIEERPFNAIETYALGDTEITISGVPFLRGRLKRAYEPPDPNFPRLEMDVELYLSLESGLLLEGSFVSRDDGAEVHNVDRTPIALTIEGQRGFLATQSAFPCNG